MRIFRNHKEIATKIFIANHMAFSSYLSALCNDPYSTPHIYLLILKANQLTISLLHRRECVSFKEATP